MSTQIERAIEKIQVKDPVPAIDFTQHVLEDGNIISTQERVVKDVGLFILFQTCIAELCLYSGTSSSNVYTDSWTVL